MAAGTVKPENGNNNKRTYVVGDDPRVVHLEGRVERVEGDVRDIKAGVNKLLERPQNPGFSQVITTLVSTLAFCSFIFVFAEWRLTQALVPVKAEITGIQTQAEKKNDSLNAALVEQAIQAERMTWVKELAKREKAP